jgi:amphi-Trp domain-containing protein
MSETTEFDVDESDELEVGQIYSSTEFVAELRRLADAIENGEQFEIEIAGERIAVPADVYFSVEHEREDDDEELEFQISWSRNSEDLADEEASAANKAEKEPA